MMELHNFEKLKKKMKKSVVTKNSQNFCTYYKEFFF